MKQKRDMVILGVSPREFLVHAKGSAEEVREGLRKMLSSTVHEVEEIDSRLATRLKSRLSAAQLSFVKQMTAKTGVRSTAGYSTYRLRLADDALGLVATATATGNLRFNPSIVDVPKPIGGGIGPVGITVGVGVAGRF